MVIVCKSPAADKRSALLALATIGTEALLHGHCHQKSFAAMKPVEAMLKLIPGLNVSLIESSCCGMAGAFGYGAETCETSIAMAELSLLPAVRRAEESTIIVADGTGRHPLHVARVLAMSLERAHAPPT